MTEAVVGSIKGKAPEQCSKGGSEMAPSALLLAGESVIIKVTWLSPLTGIQSRARRGAEQSRDTGAFPDHITPLCLPVLTASSELHPGPDCNINLPQNADRSIS